jgi:hypothetical protein
MEKDLDSRDGWQVCDDGDGGDHGSSTSRDTNCAICSVAWTNHKTQKRSEDLENCNRNVIMSQRYSSAEGHDDQS